MMFYLTLAALAVASTAQNDLRSKDFALQLSSTTNETLNGSLLYACHEGAATESLCPGGKPSDEEPLQLYAMFHFNTSTSSANPNDTKWDNIGGILGYDLPYNHDQIQPSAMFLYIQPTSNVALPIITPAESSSTSVFFEECGSMYIKQYYDDTTIPPYANTSEAHIKNWYICDTYYGYHYRTLAWVVGLDSHSTPQNPTCEKVDVKRVYA
ncbi:hypothetical protein BDV96DRAFT_640633 [Lophiotrema nucula]|uniref:DUF7907 domain-containing protein n=1 Tax=Lophiotrema nucula TaxID=690887 RepID=A0A6A5ZSH7_9PLEO|nr:hypothetical protein BDV96DRAFT_640633 [Lophiotrema nucula]